MLLRNEEFFLLIVTGFYFFVKLMLGNSVVSYNIVNIVRD